MGKTENIRFLYTKRPFSGRT